jgi:uncharacterized protein involved in cysteine biosynthesis
MVPRRRITAVDDDVDWAWRMRTGAIAFVGLVVLAVLFGLLVWLFLNELAPWIVRLVGVGGDPD